MPRVGKMAAAELVKLLGDKGKLLVNTQPPVSTAQDQRTQGFEEELKYHSASPISGRSTLAALIAQNPKQEGEMAMQTAAALIEANRFSRRSSLNW